MHFRYVLVGILPNLYSAAQVELPNGLILGGKTVNARYVVDSERVSVDQYLGVPFADPPVGELRFRPPREFSGRWEDGRQFTVGPNDCYNGKVGTDEDCLYLNVYRPTGTVPGDSLPVMVWIFGGGFTNGRIGGTDGTELTARENVILVVPAYRLGAFGFFASSETLAESGTTGNWGILDQRMALQWVNANIVSFGGDNTRVTLFGHSAGAMSIATHLTSPGSRGLFHRAILASPSASSPYFFRSLTDSYQFADWTAQTAGCADSNDLVCLRRLPAARLVVKDGHRDTNPPPWASRLFPFMSFGVTLDGVVLAGTPLERARLGDVANVPVIIGVVQDEGTVFSGVLDSFMRPKLKGDIKEEHLANITTHLLGDYDGFATKYLKEEFPRFREFVGPFEASVSPPSTTPVPKDVNRPLSELEVQFSRLVSRDVGAMSETELFAEVPILAALGNSTESTTTPYDRAPVLFYQNSLRDSIFTCSSLGFAEAVAAHNGNRVWFYNFDVDVYSGTMMHLMETRWGADKGNSITVAEYGAFHGSELPFIWNDFPETFTLPNEMASSMSFTGAQFCPVDSFKRRAASQIGCIFTSFAKCGAPQCPTHTCEGVAHWDSHPKVMHIEHKGEFTMKTIPMEGLSPVGSILPTKEQCGKWLNRDIAFIRLAEPATPEITAVAKQAAALAPLFFAGILIAII